MSAYVIPPVNAQAMYSTGARFGISDWQLISSTVPETPPAAYNSGANYGAGVEVSTGPAGGVVQVWKSKQAGNVGRPLVEGAWWEYRGDTYALWNPGAAYTPGQQVLRVETHSIYRRVTAGTSAQAPEADTQGINWTRVATSNRWAMFDMRSGQASVVVPPLRVVLAPGVISNANVLDVSDGSVKFTLRSAGAVVWNPDASPLDSAPINSWEDYFFTPFSVRSNILESGIPPYQDGQLEMVVTAGVVITVGKLIVGDAVYIGETLKGPRVQRRGFTEVLRNKFSELEDIVPRRSIPLVSQRMVIGKQFAKRARQALDFATAVPCVFIGLDDDKDEWSDLITFLALCMDYSLDINERTEGELSIETEGV